MRTQRLGLIGTLLATGAIIAGCGSAKQVNTPKQPVPKTRAQIGQEYTTGMTDLLTQGGEDSKKHSTELKTGLAPYETKTKEANANTEATLIKYKAGLQKAQDEVDEFLRRQNPNYTPKPTTGSP